MKFHDGILYRIVTGLFIGLTGFFALALFGTCFQGVLLGVLEWPCLLLVNVFFYIPLSVKYQTASGELTPEGIYVRHFFRRRFYAWSQIQQAGILYRSGRGGGHYDIILVKPGGSPRKPGTLTGLFLLRNLFRLIHLPDDQELIDYIAAHLGPLAYDQRRGIWNA